MERRGSGFLVGFLCGLSVLSQISGAQEASVDGAGAGDVGALMGFQKEADSEGVLSGSWNVSVAADHCKWDGILCNGEKRVIRVELNGRRLKGTFAANTLSRLSELQVLSLSSNSFTGPFPSDLASLTGLLQFWAQNSTFSGPFPVFGNGARLQILGLSGNNLTGPIPDLTGLSRLKTLDASHNSFEGRIPSLPSSLAELNLSSNGLSGSFPDFPRNDTSLRALDLSSNNLTGQLPDLAGLNNLKTLDLSHNFFEGRIPPLPSDLGTFNLSYNSLTGIIPTEASRFGADSFRRTFVQTDGSSFLAASPNGPNTTEPPPQTPPAAPQKKSKLSTLNLVFIALGVVVLLLVMVFGLKKLLARREADRAAEKGSGDNEDDSGNKMATTSLEKSERSKLSFMDESQHGYDLEDLLRASAEMLGKGSFGTAYKAVLDSGVIVAVKRLRDAKDMSKKDFDHHMATLGKLRHPNLVPLRAYYNAKEEKLLIYDFMPNGNLFSLLHGKLLKSLF